MKTNRIYSIDTLRFFANFCIVLTHTRVFYTKPTDDLHGPILWISYFVYHLSRLALPFFFIFSGYFYSKSLLRGTGAKSKFQGALKKLMPVYVSYVALYALIPGNGATFLNDVDTYGWMKTYYWYFQELLSDPLHLILHGTKYHLWFLPALIIGLSVITVFHLFRKGGLLVYVFVASYLLMIVIKPYDHQPILSEISNLSYGIFFGICKAIAYVSCGHLLAQKSYWEKKTAFRFLAGGVLILIIESWLVKAYDIHILVPVWLGTLPCTVGIFILALNYPGWGEGHFASKFGLLTLWIYGVHPFVLDQLEPLGQYVRPWIWSLLFPISVYFISLIITLLFQQLVTLRRLRTDKISKIVISHAMERET